MNGRARKSRVLLVEDEESMVVGVAYALEREGYEVAVARDGAAAVDALRATLPDLVLLDVMLPKRSGFDVLTWLRRSGRTTPTILLTAKGADADKVRGFDLGADDYVTKPFSLAELLARVRARLRRAEDAEAGPSTIDFDAVTADLDALVVRRGEETEALTPREVDMLRLLWRERGRAVSRARFLDEIWRAPDVTTRTVDQHVAQLRKKIERDPARPTAITTVFGVGYRLEARGGSAAP
jgi:DNA-binding response OmpR family regulator